MPECIENNDDKAIDGRFCPTLLLVEIWIATRSIIFFARRGRRRLYTGRLGNIRAIAVMGKLSSGEEKASGEEQNGHTVEHKD